jgi:hypothetical protein
MNAPTPEQLQHFLDCVALELAHARTFVTSREKMHPDGIEQYDMVLNSARHIRDAMRATSTVTGGK